MHALYFALQALDVLHAALFGLPARFHLVELILQVGKLLLQLLEAFAAELVLFLFQGHLFDFHLHDAAADIVQLGRHRVDLGPDQRAGLVHQVDGLVGEETVADIAVGERRRGHQGVVVNADAVIDLIALLQTAQDRDGVLHARLVHLYRLEAALQRGVLFNILAVFVQRGGADAVQLAPGQHGLEQVAGIHAALGLAGTDDGVQLVDEENDAALGLPDLLEHRLQTLFKFAAVLRAGDQRAHIQRKDALVLQAFRHVALDDALGEAFGDGSLADAGFTDQHRVVLRLPRENPDDVADLVVTADDGVQLVFAGPPDQIGAVFREGVIGALGVVAVHRGGFDLAELGGEGVFGNAVVRENALDGRRRRGEDADHQVLDRDVGVAHRLGRLFGRSDDAAGLRGEIGIAGAADLRQGGNGAVQLGQHRVAVNAHLAEQGGDQTAVLIDERVEQMLGHDIVVSVFECHGLCRLDGLQAFLSQVLRIHVVRPPFLES